MRPKGFALIGVCMLLVSACNGAKESYYNDRIGGGPQIAGMSLDAKQRLVWTPRLPVRTLDRTAKGAYAYAVEERPILCAEPSPDAVSAFASNLTTSLGLGLQKVDVDASFARSVVETVQSLSQRTEMIQLLRDGYYRACEAYANGMMGEFGYGLLLNQLDDVILRVTALQVVGEQRPLPEDPKDREALRGVDAAQTKLGGAKDSLDVARAELVGARGQAQQAHADSLRAKAERAGAEKERDALKAQAATAADADKARINDRIAALEGMIAKATQSESASAQAISDAQKRLDAAQTGVAGKETERRAAEQGVIDAHKAAAQVVRPPVSAQALSAVTALVTGSNSRSTTAGACLMWLAQHPEILSTPSPNEPAIADVCRNFARASLSAGLEGR